VAADRRATAKRSASVFYQHRVTVQRQPPFIGTDGISPMQNSLPSGSRRTTHLMPFPSPAGPSVDGLVDKRSAESNQAFDLVVWLPGGEVHMHPVLAGRGIFDPKEQDLSNAPSVGRSKAHELVTFVDHGVAGHSRPEAT
jgi:hypothetical protein